MHHTQRLYLGSNKVTQAGKDVINKAAGKRVACNF